MKILFVFVDGLGLGKEDPKVNPLYSARIPTIRRMMKEYMMIPTDTLLGVSGLPQSATGQTAILTGHNAPGVLGRHLHGQPTVTLKKLLNQYSLFKQLKEKGLKVTNANVYRDVYLQQIHNPTNRKTRPSASTVACMAAQLPLRKVEDLVNRQGVYHDIINEILIESDYHVEKSEPEAAAEVLLSLVDQFDFTFFEYFLTDIVGHKQDREKSEEVLERLDRFITVIDKELDYENTLLMITSDHGNIEDLTVKTHTYNKVPTILHGYKDSLAAQKIASLVDITPTILGLYNEF